MLFRIQRGWLSIPGLALALVIATPTTSVAQKDDKKQDDKKQKEKQTKEQREEAQALLRLVDAAMKGQPAPTDFTLGWDNDFMKATDGKIYVPFTLSIPTAIENRSMSFYLRVVAKSAPPAPDPAAAGKEAKAQTPAPTQPPVWAFEDIHLLELKPPCARMVNQECVEVAKGQPYRVSRAFAVPGGEYDVYLAVRERKADRGKTQRTTVQKQALTVPDYWNDQLTTSTVILADRVEPRSTPASVEEQVERPYLIGNTEIVPAADTSFTKAEELSVIFLIYNPGLKEKKPDVTVEYRFHQKTADGEKYFNRTSPTQLNASTLPPAFDFDLGHQLVAGQSVPLASFPEGDYRLEIEVVDNLGQKKLTREVRFTVAGS